MRCGPFQLLRPIAQGGMGSVWEARAGDTGVAVKFVTTRDPSLRARFATEVRAHASLSHPHILEVLDLGVLEHDVVGGPPAGTDWMAVELVRGGDAKQLVRTATWPEAVSFFSAVLDGLAEAHARGVTHLDLKPGNLLLAGRDDLRPGVKIADFGIAHLRGVVDDSGEITGTATILAPEQCEGDPRAFGPWTDLYALGCMAYATLCGRWPFRTRPFTAAMLDHLTKPPPPLEPRMAVPKGVAGWVERLLSKEPSTRFPSAVEALEELWDLANGLPPVDHPALAASRSSLKLLREADRTSWRRPAAPPPPMPLLSAGIGLLPLRARPAVGLEGPRDVLWELLTETRAERVPRAVVLHGPRGAGLSHLGGWLSHVAARELGVLAVRVEHFADDGPADALLRSIRALLNLQGVADEALPDAVPRQLQVHGIDDPDLATLLVGLLDGRVDAQAHAPRRGAYRRLLVSLGPRGVIGWIDDAEGCRDAVRFAENTLRNLRDVPILFVLASHQELDFGAPATLVEVGPLSPVAATALVRGTLPMDLGAERRIIDASDHLGGRIVRTIERLAAEDRLVRASRGFDLAPGVSLEVQASALPMNPADAHERQALAVAAAMAGEVADAAWLEALDDPEAPGADRVALLRARERVREQLLRAGILRPTRSGLRWVDPGERVAVRRAFPAEASEAHRRLATVLESRTPRHVRVARHWRDANDLERAADAYTRSLHHEVGMRERGAREYVAAVELLELYDRLGLSASDTRRILPTFARCYRVGENEEGREELERALTAARHHGWVEVEACCLAQLATVATGARKEDLATQAVEVLERVEQDVLWARIAIPTATALFRSQRYDEALRLQRASLEIARKLDNTFLTQVAETSVLNTLQSMGELHDRELCLRKAAELESNSLPVSAAVLYICAGSIAYDEGDLDASDDANQRAAELMRVSYYAPSDALVPHLNLAKNGLARREPARMRTPLDRAWRLRADDRLDGPLLVLELVWALLVDDATQVERRLTQLAAFVERGPLDPESRDLLREAADEVATPALGARMRAVVA